MPGGRKSLRMKYNCYVEIIECGRCKFRLRTDRTSLTNLRASNIGNKHNKAVSWASENQERMGIALSIGKKKKIAVSLSIIGEK